VAADVPTRRPALTRRTLQAVIGVLALLLVVGTALLVTTRGSSAAEPETDPALRNEVKRVASSFAANVNTYSAANIEDYRKNVEPLLTPTFAKSFEKSMNDIVKQMKSAELESKGEVKAAGVSSLDADSAVVLVVCDADVTSTHGDRERHFRWRVDLVREGEDGDWLVDEFKPV
jgi:Mce-associated membrane protein